MLGINGDECYTTIPVFELIEAILEGEDFGRTDETERSGDEEKNQPGRFGIRRRILGGRWDISCKGDFC